jgi:hypothetical protein
MLVAVSDGVIGRRITNHSQVERASRQKSEIQVKYQTRELSQPTHAVERKIG